MWQKHVEYRKHGFRHVGCTLDERTRGLTTSVERLYSCPHPKTFSSREQGLDCSENGVSRLKLPIKEGYWRASVESVTIRECFNEVHHVHRVLKYGGQDLVAKLGAHRLGYISAARLRWLMGFVCHPCTKKGGKAAVRRLA